MHIDKNGNDLNGYASTYVGGTYILAYGIKDYLSDISPDIYDSHESFEILNDRVKMLVSLDMNGK